MRQNPRFTAGDKVWAGHYELAIFIAGHWWTAPLRGTVYEYSFCEGAQEWFYVILLEAVKPRCVFPESMLRRVSVLDVMADVASLEE